MCLCPNMILHKTNIYDVEKFGYSILYAMRYEISDSEIDEYNISRVIFNVVRSAKNLADNNKAWGLLKKYLGGAYEIVRVR